MNSETAAAIRYMAKRMGVAPTPTPSAIRVDSTGLRLSAIGTLPRSASPGSTPSAAERRRLADLADDLLSPTAAGNFRRSIMGAP
jgi:hypothetical protein